LFAECACGRILKIGYMDWSWRFTFWPTL